ncbi:MAG TPA: hypothetical protein VJ085_06305, partial [Candidatus Acidoferrales bacterium]|nr:hypothetical protein [Candidatus Acidoferrales bacterium]
MPAKKKTVPRKKAPAKKAKPARPENGAPRWVGQSLRRKEEARLVRGQGKFVDDYKLPGMLHMCLVRSPYGHARLLKVDVSEAERAPGV